VIEFDPNVTNLCRDLCYLDCSLKAAWMCQEFSMTFVNAQGALYPKPESILAAYSAPRPHRWYLHHTSEHLLKPKVGDYVRLNGKCFGSRGRITAIAERGYKLANGTAVWWAQPDSVEAIEQRKGKPFFYPETE
jgi:hypothetical protein